MKKNTENTIMTISTLASPSNHALTQARIKFIGKIIEVYASIACACVRACMCVTCVSKQQSHDNEHN